MTEKRFTLKKHLSNEYGLLDNKEEIAYISHKSAFTICDLLNKLHEENQKCREYNGILYSNTAKNEKKLLKEIKQVKQDNKMLFQCIENQSVIIQELYSKLMSYQIKEPIILTKEDLELMGKAISYYTHEK